VKIHSQAIHAGDRKKPDRAIPSTTPVVTATTYLYDKVEELDRIFGHEINGFSYARYDTPTTAALEELCTTLEAGAESVACASGMAALHLALMTALADRRKTILAAESLYGATINLLMDVFEPMGVAVHFVDVCDMEAVEKAVAEHRPGCVLIETVSNPLLRVGPIDRIAEVSRAAGAALIVDSTFATPLLVRPMELGAHMVVHSLTKYLAGHGDVLGGLVVSDAGHLETLHKLSRVLGPQLGAYEAYLAMRGIKTFALRMERHCANACRVAAWLASHPKVERVYYLADPQHPDAETVRRMFPEGLYGGMVSFEIRRAGREEIFRFIDALKMVVRGTSLGDVHSLILYPVISSHREISPKQRERMGIRDNLVRLSVGIEAADDIIADLEQALSRV